MQIDTKQTVQKTQALYHWDDLRNWTRKGNLLTRHIYRDENLVIYQQIRSGNRHIVFETPEYVMRVIGGTHKGVMTHEKGKKVPFFELAVSTTVSKRNLYRSLIDDAGYIDIKGERQYILDFEKILSQKYFCLKKDEHSSHISTYWMRTGGCNLMPRQQLLNKERS